MFSCGVIAWLRRWRARRRAFLAAYRDTADGGYRVSPETYKRFKGR